MQITFLNSKSKCDTKLSTNENLQFGLIFLINHIKEHRINGNMTVHVDLKPVIPPQYLRRTLDIHFGFKQHLSLRDVGKELSSVVGQLEPVEPSRDVEQLAGAGRLGSGLDGSGAEERALVEDGHGGGGVLDGSDVGIDDVYGQDELGV